MQAETYKVAGNVRPDAEEPLSRGVVRVGATVRRPLKPGAQFVHDLLDHFEREGFDGAPRYCGIDSQGREILSYIHGFTPPHNGFELSEEAVAASAVAAPGAGPDGADGVRRRRGSCVSPQFSRSRTSSSGR
jgi:hypothetical protein